jgi:hypothetical protein
MLSVSTRNALTGRWAISRDAYVVLAPTSIGSVVLTEASTFQVQELGGWLIASAGGYGVFCLMLFGAHKTLFRNRHVTPIPIWWIFALGLTSGAIKGSATAIISILLNLDENIREAITSRMFAAGLLGLLGVPGVALIMNSLGEFRYKRAELIAEQLLIESKEVQNLNEAFIHFKDVMDRGLEGTILKSVHDGWRDGKPSFCVKLKCIKSFFLKFIWF